MPPPAFAERGHRRKSRVPMITKNYNITKNNSTKSNHNERDELEVIAKKMDEICKRRLRDGVIQSGNLQGKESEIRQEALIMAIGGFLQQNSDYLNARINHDEEAINDSMEKCIAITLRICKMRVASRSSSSLESHLQLTESNGGICHHPSQLKPTDWSSDQKTGVIMQAVVKAVRAGKLSMANASIISMICEQGMRAEEVAVVWKISRSAVYQQIQRVRRVIPDIIKHVDI